MKKKQKWIDTFDEELEKFQWTNRFVAGAFRPKERDKI